jgi:hypothetical protein
MHDSSDATADSVMYTSTELTLTLVCVSLPIFRPLVRRLSSYYSYDRTDTKERSGAGYESQRATLERMRPAKVNPRTASDAEVGLDFLTAEGARKSSCNDDASNGLSNIWRQDSSSTKSILDKRHGIVRRQEVTISYDRNDAHFEWH